MTLRSLALVLPLLAALVTATSLEAQRPAAHQWTLSRPDAVAPASVSADRTLAGMEIQVSLKAFSERMRGLGVGGDSLSLSQLTSLFSVAPTQLVSQGAELGLLVGITPHLTVGATGKFSQKTMELVVADPRSPQLNWIAQTESLGPEDLELFALYNVFDQGALRVHVQAGASVPLGGIDSSDETMDPRDPGASITEVQLPYQQQQGSGTIGLLPGLAANLQNEVASLGLQAHGVIRLGENDRGWALGDMFQGAVWAGYVVSDWASVSAGARYTAWGNVEGFDQVLTTSTDLAYDSPVYNSLQAGSRVEIPLGINFFLTEGRFAGHRLGVEFLFPVHQSLDYLQLRKGWGVVVGWQKAFSF
jgi:hypothetical protein